MKPTQPPLELDVRPILAQRRPPLPPILDAVSRLEVGQALRIISPFDPAPLRDLLAARGFVASTHQSAPGEWITDLTPQAPD